MAGCPQAQRLQDNGFGKLEASKTKVLLGTIAEGKGGPKIIRLVP